MRKLLKNEPLKIIIGLCLFVPGLILEHLGFTTSALCLFIPALLVSGLSVFIDAVRGILRRDFLDEKFLMSVASVGAIAIGEAEEGVAVMLFYLVGEWFMHLAVKRSRKSIKSLMDICPDTANLLVDGVEEEVDATDVEVGQTIIIRSGERVPVDCVVIDGACDIDTSMLTGESLPVSIKVGDSVSSGVVVIGGVITARATAVADESAAQRILELVENATERKSREESFITAFSRIYTPVVTILALIMALVPSLFGWLEFTEALYRALSFLVVSCPCALVISVPMAFFGGIGGASSIGVLYKGGNTFSPISRAECVVFDKTGTLTEGRLSIGEVLAVGMDREELLNLSASAEYGSTHPIAECLRNEATQLYPATDIVEHIGKGVVATVNGKRVAVGNAALIYEVGTEPEGDSSGTVLVSVDGVFCGAIELTDTIKSETKEAIMALRALGVKKTYILSGDRESSVSSVAQAVGVDEAFYGLLPADKLAHLESIIEKSRGSVLYVGDGVNDAPCIARADVGISMGSLGTDSAIEASDLVITSDKLTRISDAIGIARKTLAISKQNIVFAIGIKVLVLLLVAFNLAGMWMAVFADVGVAVLAILNSMRTLLVGRKVKKGVYPTNNP